MPAYKDKTGKWFCKFYYTDWQGNNRQKWKRGFATKKEALAYERDFLEKQSANPDMTFQNLYELYMLTSHVFPTQVKTRHQSRVVNDGAYVLHTLKKCQDFGSGF